MTKRVKIELSFIFLFNLLAYFIFLKIDAFESVISIVNDYEALELDELFMVFITLIVSLIFFAINRLDEIEQIKQKVKLISNYDPVTQLLNRRAMEKLFVREVRKANQRGGCFSVILIELDQFREIGMLQGACAANNMLHDVVNTLQIYLRTKDKIARWKDNSLLILCSETETQEAVGMTSKLLQSIRHISVDNFGYVTASLGVTSYQPQDNWQTIMERIQIGLNTAKDNGKNCFITMCDSV
ncbi:GGDEF domain-containing protein [Aliikangiella maris]|uniref:GGDEF domain-containing protein n=2 Tax=Aliikangiella maris TaxID=3162458 RepID=A0ABV3MJ74_9GAMM